ncbi:hypothetical protein TELCIR_17224, partial [Teladorsagia circumcincta]
INDDNVSPMGMVYDGSGGNLFSGIHYYLGRFPSNLCQRSGKGEKFDLQFDVALLVFLLAAQKRESEHKRYLKWSDDGTKIFYENYKTYVISDEHTCPECSWDDIVTIPNPTGIGAAASIYDPQYNISKVAQKILGFGLLLLGEYPFISHSVRDILFDGYNDPVLDVGRSQIVYFLSGILNGGKSIIPIPIPDMPVLGFFQGVRFSVPYDDYDTTADANIGFRYRNIEKVNYFPDWPSCPK